MLRFQDVLIPAEHTSQRPLQALRDFLHEESSGGFVLMAAAMLSLLVANSPLATPYFNVFHQYVGGLSVLHWINDGLMALFFLLVGLEIKREMLEGQLASWPQRILPGIAALGGMIVPALLYFLFARGDAAALRGWAIPMRPTSRSRSACSSYSVRACRRR